MLVLIDRIGIRSGMHYYDLAFDYEAKKRNIETLIISNFTNQSQKIEKAFDNFYEANGLAKIWRFLIAYFKIIKICFKHQDDTLIYQSFGEKIDYFILFSLLPISKNLTVLVHEITPLDFMKNCVIKILSQTYFKLFKGKLIIHSEHNKIALGQINKKLPTTLIPHFKYSFSKVIDEKNVSSEISSSIKKNQCNALFFGHIRKTKGIKTFIDAKQFIPESARVNFIIAGRDSEELLNTLPGSDSISTISKYINDDEMNYLFCNSDLIILPYTEVSQSGILEAACHFKKPIITSDIPFFMDFLRIYPSFGSHFRVGNAKNLADIIIFCSKTQQKWYLAEEIEKHSCSNIFNNFFRDLSKNSTKEHLN